METNKTDITDEQIVALREEAANARDYVVVDLCNVVLSGEDSDGTGITLGKPVTLEYARTECARVIAEARAQAQANA